MATASGEYLVFISHAAAEGPIAVGVARSLTELGPACFLASSDIPRTTEWLPKIEESLLNCDALVVLLTLTARDSAWVDQEIGFALGRRKRVIPVRLFPSDPPPHGFLGRIQALDARETPQESIDFAKLATAIFCALFAELPDRVRLIPFVLQGLARERRLAPLRQWATLLLLARNELDHEQREQAAQAMRRNAALRTDREAYTTVRIALNHSL